MHSTFFNLWKEVFDRKLIDSNTLRQAVITTTNAGDITKEEYKEITGRDFFETISIFN